MTIDLKEIQRVRDEADCLMSALQVDQAIAQMAGDITARLKYTNPMVYCVMNGGLIFAGQLIPKLDFPLEVAYLHATRYGHALTGTFLDWRVRPTHDITGRSVLVIDDILDEGHTLDAIVNYLKSEGAKEVLTAVLVHKIHDRKVRPGQRADFSGLDVEDRYLFGCGMDYKGYWRNLPGIYALKESG
jgi:hypoxanthine phosphoribosyltransferase